MKRYALPLLALLLLSTLVACRGTLEVGVEKTPTPDYAATATMAALATENARLATQVATLITPTPTPNLGKVAYVQGGDIWAKALPDGEPQRLTTDGRNSGPRWSPSGQWLAFRKGDFRQVWVMRADGSEARSVEAVPNGAFAWSPVADRLAFADGDRLKVVNANGTEPVTLVAGPPVVPPTPPPEKQGEVGRIAWSADGAWIAYEWYENGPKQPLAYQGLWKVPANSGKLIELYASGAPEKGEAVLAGWSLDGQHILFWQGEILSASILADGVALYSLPAGGGGPLKLVDTVLVHDDFLASAPQGNSLAMTAGGYRATWTNKRVAMVGAGGGELTWLTDESVAAFSPAWSPDGAHLAYAAMPDRGDLVGGEDARLGMMERRIWMVNVQGEPQLQQLTNDPAYRDERPLWSADGSYILFARMDAEDRASLWLITAEGGEPQQMVDELTPAPEWFGYYGHVEWDSLFDWWRGPVVQQVQPDATRVVPAPIPATSLPPTPTATVKGATVVGRVVLGYGSHQPVADLPLWVGRESQGEPATRTNDNGEFTLMNSPTGLVDVVNSHLAFQVLVSSPGAKIDLGVLKYPLIHPPTFYWQKPAPLPNLSALVTEGQPIEFSICQTDTTWSRPSEQVQRDTVWSKRPFSHEGDEFLKWWFRQPAVMYDTMDVFVQSFPDGPNLDAIASDWRYLLGMWTGEDLSRSKCAYDAYALDGLLARKQIEVWLLGYQAHGVKRLGEDFAVQVTLATGFQIIRFVGSEGPVSVHIVEDGAELLQLPRFCRSAANPDCLR